MRKSKKIEKNLNSRVAGYHQALAILNKEGRRTTGYHMPGSRSGRK
jgi:hypothetical protein